jgi:hypothetical protein
MPDEGGDGLLVFCPQGRSSTGAEDMDCGRFYRKLPEAGDPNVKVTVTASNRVPGAVVCVSGRQEGAAINVSAVCEDDGDRAAPGDVVRDKIEELPDGRITGRAHLTGAVWAAHAVGVVGFDGGGDVVLTQWRVLQGPGEQACVLQVSLVRKDDFVKTYLGLISKLDAFYRLLIDHLMIVPDFIPGADVMP